MRHSWQNFMVGLCAIIALAGMSALLLLFGELTFLLERRYEVPISAPDCAALRSVEAEVAPGPGREAARARVDARNSAGETALMFAAAEGSPSAVRLLLDRGADPRVRTKRNETALGYAGTAGNDAVVRRLLEHGAEVNAQSHVGTTALAHVTTRGGRHAVIALLQDERLLGFRKP
mgnify:CR=1 FL=1